MERPRSAFVVSRNCLVASLIVLVITSSGYGSLTYYTDSASFDTVAQTSVVEDFESVPVKNTALASFTSNGNTYTGLAGVPSPNVWVSSPGYTNFGVLVTDSCVLTANGDEDFMVVFGSPTTTVGFDTYINELGPASIEIHGTAGLLDTFILSHDSTTVGFLGLIADEPIRTVRWTTTNGSDVNTGIDNIRQGTHAHTPAPGAIVLCTIGTSVVTWLRRRRML